MVSGFFKYLKLKPKGPRDVPLRTLLKGAAILVIAPYMLLAIYTFYGVLDIEKAIFGALFVFCISIIFIRPYIANLSALTNYVSALTKDKKAAPPNLSFLNNVEELTGAVMNLHTSWERRRERMENIIAENKILIDTLPDSLILLDSKFKIVRTNQTSKKLFRTNSGYLQEILEADLVREGIESVFDKGIGRILEYNAEKLNPSANFLINIERFPSYAGGEIALLVAMHDITAQKNTEKMLADFVANASHEIRTPLTSIIGFIETLQGGAKDDSRAREEFLKIMASQAGRMERLVGDLLSLSRIEMNMHTMPTDSIEVVPLLQEVVKQAQLNASSRDIDIKLDVIETLPKICGDKEQVLMAFDNLIMNAVKYTMDKTDIHVVAKMTTAKDEGISGYDGKKMFVRVEVHDKGEGIDSEHIPRLAERFYRVNTLHTQKVSGTGLGLSIVKNVMDRHCGRLLIESTPGEGSIFTLLWPALGE